MSGRWPTWPAAVLGLVVVTACDDSSCEEDQRALLGLPEITLYVGHESLPAELASSEGELARGLMHRRCLPPALVLAPAEETQLELWGCNLVSEVYVGFVRDDRLVSPVQTLKPCPGPCQACPRLATDGPVDFAIEWTREPEVSDDAVIYYSRNL